MTPNLTLVNGLTRISATFFRYFPNHVQSHLARSSHSHAHTPNAIKPQPAPHLTQQKGSINPARRSASPRSDTAGPRPSSTHPQSRRSPGARKRAYARPSRWVDPQSSRAGGSGFLRSGAGYDSAPPLRPAAAVRFGDFGVLRRGAQSESQSRSASPPRLAPTPLPASPPWLSGIATLKTLSIRTKPNGIALHSSADTASAANS